MFQSTHPCGVRRLAVKNLVRTMCFNPRTRVGCDTDKGFKNEDVTSFNPRTRVGCDTIKDLVFEPSGVSIHAPVWGATFVAV